MAISAVALRPRPRRLKRKARAVHTSSARELGLVFRTRPRRRTRFSGVGTRAAVGAAARVGRVRRRGHHRGQTGIGAVGGARRISRSGAVAEPGCVSRRRRIREVAAVRRRGRIGGSRGVAGCRRVRARGRVCLRAVLGLIAVERMIRIITLTRESRWLVDRSRAGDVRIVYRATFEIITISHQRAATTCTRKLGVIRMSATKAKLWNADVASPAKKCMIALNQIVLQCSS